MLVAFNHCLTLIPMNLLTTVTQLFWRHTAPFINRLHTPLKQFLTMSPFSRNVLPCNDSIQSNLWTLAGGSSGSGSGSGWSCRTFPQLTHDREAVSTGPGHQDTGMGSWLKRILMEVVLRSSFIDKTCLATIAISFEADLLKKMCIHCKRWSAGVTHMWSGNWGEFRVARSTSTYSIVRCPICIGVLR